jgi:hypothetical protein
MCTEQDEVKRSFQVEIERVRTHIFVVDEVNSPEEAEAVAEAWLSEGEEGTVLDEEILNSDSYPVENKEDLN